MAGWHHWLDGHGSGWTSGVGDGQGGLVCCDSWGRKESDTTDRLNWTELNWGSWNQPLTYTEGQIYTHSHSIRKWSTVLRNDFLLLSVPLYWELLILLLKLCEALKIQLYWNFQKQLLTIVVMLPLDPWIHSAHRTSTLYTSTSPHLPKPLPLVTTILLSAFCVFDFYRFHM